MTPPHTTFGTAEVFAAPTFGTHPVVELPDSVYVDQSDLLLGVTLKFGWEDSHLPNCGKCQSPMRAVERPDGTSVWIAEDTPWWTPFCSSTLEEGISDEEMVERMWHEPDRSVGSWVRSASIRVDDEAGTLTFTAKMPSERLVFRLSRLPSGEVQATTKRWPKRCRMGAGQ
jgi:hypothetical protein